MKAAGLMAEGDLIVERWELDPIFGGYYKYKLLCLCSTC
jgi:hypothetical protein